MLAESCECYIVYVFCPSFFVFVSMCYWQSVSVNLNDIVLSHRACLGAIATYYGPVANLLMDVILKFLLNILKLL